MSKLIHLLMEQMKVLKLQPLHLCTASSDGSVQLALLVAFGRNVRNRNSIHSRKLGCDSRTPISDVRHAFQIRIRSIQWCHCEFILKSFPLAGEIAIAIKLIWLLIIIEMLQIRKC